MLKIGAIIAYSLLMLGAMVSCIIQNPYTLAFACTLILATFIDKSNYESIDVK